MDITPKIESLQRMIKSKKTHSDFARVVEIAKEYKSHVSGIGLEEYLKQFNLREDDAMFEQRKRLTNAISKPVASSIKKPFYKVSRNRNIKTEIEIEDKKKLDAVNKMVRNFYGSDKLNNRGLDFWLKNRFLELVFVDPNSWIVVEWEAKPLNEVLEPVPFEVSCENVINFKFKNGVLQNLLVKTEELQMMFNGRKEAKEEVVDAYTLYEIGWSLKMVPVDPQLIKLVDLASNQKLVVDDSKVKEVVYLATYNETKLDFIPAFRVGYLRDEATDGRTFVSPMDYAIPYFRKALKAVSELDLSIALHTFPQKIAYYSPCQHRDGNNKCKDGTMMPSKSTCSSCHGTGIAIHKSGQDIILHKMPEDKSEMFDLDKSMVYRTPPIELIKFQDDYVRSLKEDAHLAIFNSTMFLMTEKGFAKTATEVDFNSEGINDTLFPYTEKFSEIWKTIVQICIKLSGFNGQFSLKHIFPSDLKLKSTGMLMNEYKIASDSNAPSFVIDQITAEIAGQIYNGDDLAMKKFEVRRKFFPFKGNSKEEIALFMATPYVAVFTKILYANYEAIFTDIEKENPTFYVMDYTKQWEILTKAVEVFKTEIENQTQSERIDFMIGNPSGASDQNPTPGTDSGDDNSKQ